MISTAGDPGKRLRGRSRVSLTQAPAPGIVRFTEMNPGEARPDTPALTRAARMMTRARDAFYDRRYEEAIERCQETLTALLPDDCGAPAAAAPPTPDELADRFLGVYAGLLPLVEAERIAAVFTFFVRRKARFSYQRGRPLPRREWWEFLQITREEAAEILNATRLTLETVQRGARLPGPPGLA